MALRQQFSQKLEQRLSPQQIQLMKLLQVPTMELDQRIKQEIEEGKLVRLSEVELSSYGYFLARPSSGPNAHSVEEFVQWLKDTQTNEL